MASHWGRKETIVWQPHMPIYSYTALAGALLCAVLFLWESYAFQQEPLQKAYAVEYLRSTFGAQFNLHGEYRIVTLAGVLIEPRPALPLDFVPGKTLQQGGVMLPVTLSPATLAQGYDVFYRAPTESYSDKLLCRWFREAVFGGKTLAGVYAWPFGESILVLILGLIHTIPKDVRRLKN